MNQIDFPNKIVELLEKLNSPERLSRHLQIVYSTAYELLSQIKKEWSVIELDEELILFGAGTHDIGKTKIKSEIFNSGKEHETVGKRILEELGLAETESRFALTHGNWKESDLLLEDLLVSLADKIWKGKRVEELEERVGHAIANKLKVDYWDVYVKLDKILEEISIGADERLIWQNQ
ncbi:HD domain-containing protein [Chondrinema litorale]|uniref:HD domain-containing protein n=1 Tax=Chondrinema litorale TaxID=2994555 RepID=UPI002543878C|nr:HD domain-containing protein [Chondrinema litorale]UZR94080.1 HD domain-containing protein [Chondrinema litorale]